MKRKTELPPELQEMIKTETPDFAIFSNRKHPLKKTIQLIGFAVVWTTMASSFYIFGDSPTPSFGWTPYDLFSLMPVAFASIGLGMLFVGIYRIFEPGGYFVGTPKHLIRYHRGKLNTYAWDQFTGNMEIDHNRGAVLMELRTGRMVRQQNRGSVYVPDKVFISGVANVSEIAHNCRNRIEERSCDIQ